MGPLIGIFKIVNIAVYMIGGWLNPWIWRSLVNGGSSKLFSDFQLQRGLAAPPLCVVQSQLCIVHSIHCTSRLPSRSTVSSIHHIVSVFKVSSG